MAVAGREEIFDKVKEVLEYALGADPEEITMNATLIGDLGAESIDFLDISFKLEQEFDIKIDQGVRGREEVLLAHAARLLEAGILDRTLPALAARKRDGQT